MSTRRAFITLLGGAAAAWPLAAHAQQPDRMRRIGVLLNLTSDDPEAPARVAALAQRLGELGWTVGRNVMIDYRWGAGDAERIRRFAAELVAINAAFATLARERADALFVGGDSFFFIRRVQL